MKVVVIGGVAAGMSAASKIRRSAQKLKLLYMKRAKTFPTVLVVCLII